MKNEKPITPREAQLQELKVRITDLAVDVLNMLDGYEKTAQYHEETLKLLAERLEDAERRASKGTGL